MKKSYFLMLMALVFFLSGCREELDYVNSENTQNTYQLNKDNVKTEILHKTDYEKRSFLKPSVSRIENYLNTGSGGNSSLSKHTAVQDNYEIYTDTFEEVSYLDAKYHSFYIIGDPSSGIEEKLVLKSINNQVTEKYILRYQRLPDYSIAQNSYTTTKLVESSDSQTSSMQIYIDSFSMGCSTYTMTTYDCGEGGHHNGMTCPTSGEWIPHNTVTVSFDPTCTSGSGSQTQGGTAGNTGTSTGGAPANNTIPPGETPPVITLPTTAPLYIIQRPRNVICNPLDLNQDEIDQLNGNYNIRLKIYQYLALQGYSPSVCGDLPIDQEVQDFVKFTLHFFAQNPTTTWQQFQNWFMYDIHITTDMDARVKCILQKMAGDTNISDDKITLPITPASDNLFQKMLRMFNGNNTPPLTFRYDPTLSATTGAYATTRSNNGTSYEIVIGSDLLQMSNIRIMTTLVHELTHAFMLNELNQLNMIEWMSNGEPKISGSTATTCVNNNYFSNDDSHFFAELICTYIEKPITQATPHNQWMHELFGTIILNIPTFTQYLANYVENNHDWNSESANWTSAMQTKYGTDWKAKVAMELQKDALRQTYYFTTVSNQTPDQFHTEVVGIIDNGHLPNSNNSYPANKNCN